MISLVSVILLVVLPQFASAQPADSPAYSVGDTWSWSTGFVRTVVKVDGDVTIMKGYPNCPSCLVYFDKSLNIMKIEQEEGKAADLAAIGFVPLGKDWKNYEFPLEVGKKWNFSADGLFRNNVVHYYGVITVQAQEDVTTKAGTFKAFKIQQDMTTKALDSWGRGGSWTNMVWFAPAAKAVVKFTTTTAVGL
jgi:hypothetical protein